MLRGAPLKIGSFARIGIGHWTALLDADTILSLALSPLRKNLYYKYSLPLR